MSAERAAPADPGLYGPESVTWRVHDDPSMALGGLRALLLQALHPRAMAGVAQNSVFGDDPWGRLLRTAEYVGVTTFGTVADAQLAGAAVRRIHERLAAVDPETGEGFRIDDPDLLLWVHCCLTESFLTTAMRCGLRLSPDEQDRYYAEQTANAALVGLDPTEVPTSSAAVAAYFRAVRPELRVTPDARRAAALVLWPPMPARVRLGARPAWVAVAGAAAAMLPRWARRMYALPGLPTTDLAASAAGAALRAGLLVAPDRLRHGPHMRAARERLAL